MAIAKAVGIRNVKCEFQIRNPKSILFDYQRQVNGKAGFGVDQGLPAFRQFFHQAIIDSRIEIGSGGAAVQAGGLSDGLGHAVYSQVNRPLRHRNRPLWQRARSRFGIRSGSLRCAR